MQIETLKNIVQSETFKTAILPTIIAIVTPILTGILSFFAAQMAFKRELQLASHDKMQEGLVQLILKRVEEYRDLNNALRPIRTMLYEDQVLTQKNIDLSFNRMDIWEKETNGFLMLSDRSNQDYNDLKEVLRNSKTKKKPTGEIIKLVINEEKIEIRKLREALKKAIQGDLMPLHNTYDRTMAEEQKKAIDNPKKSTQI